jgi:tetratricopeptide (TPR) repeat protein
MAATTRLRIAFRPLLATILVLASLACGSEDVMEEVRALQAAGRFNESIELLRPLVSERSDDGEVQYRYGMALSRTGALTEALWSLRAAERDPDWKIPAATQLAMNSLRARDADGALESLDKILAEDPDNVGALLLHAEALAATRRMHDEVLADVERILELDPGNVSALGHRVVAFLALERIDEARETLAEMGEHVSDEAVGDETRGWHCAVTAIFTEESNELEEAKERYNACAEEFPSHPMVIENAIRFLEAQGDFDRSLEIVRAAVEEAPNSVSYRIALAERLRIRGELEEAEEVLLEATRSERKGTAMAGWTVISKHYMEIGEFEKSVEAADAALAIAREAGIPLAQQLIDLADALLLAGELERAMETSEEMEVEAHKFLIQGRVQMLRGQNDQALDSLRRSNQLWPSNAISRYYTALAAEAIGDFDRAIEEYRQSIRSDATATDARVRLGRIYAAEGELSRATVPLVGKVERETSGVPLELEGEFLAARVLAELGDGSRLYWVLGRFQNSPYQGRLLAEAAQGIWNRSGAARARDFLLGVEGINYAHPLNSDALRVLLEASHETGTVSMLDAVLARSLEAFPDVAVVHEVRGGALERRGDVDAARKAYERARLLDPENYRASLGLARLTLASEGIESALPLFDAAIESDPSDSRAAVAAAEALIAAGRSAEAVTRLELTLGEVPFDSASARLLADLELEKGSTSPRVLDLAMRAVRFGRSADDLDRLERVHLARGETELAARAAERARALRAAKGSDRPVQEAAS